MPPLDNSESGSEANRVGRSEDSSSFGLDETRRECAGWKSPHPAHSRSHGLWSVRNAGLGRFLVSLDHGGVIGCSDSLAVELPGLCEGEVGEGLRL